MPRGKAPPVILSAAITLDGKLDRLPPWVSRGVYIEDLFREPSESPDLGYVTNASEDVVETVRRLRGGPADHKINLCLAASQCRVLLEAELIDEIHLTLRPRVDGRRAAPTLSGPPTPEFFPRSLACRLLRMETRDGECLLRYRVLRRARAR